MMITVLLISIILSIITFTLINKWYIIPYEYDEEIINRLLDNNRKLKEKIEKLSQDSISTTKKSNDKKVKSSKKILQKFKIS